MRKGMRNSQPFFYLILRLSKKKSLSITYRKVLNLFTVQLKIWFRSNLGDDNALDRERKSDYFFIVGGSRGSLYRRRIFLLVILLYLSLTLSRLHIHSSELPSFILNQYLLIKTCSDVTNRYAELVLLYF